MLQRYSSLPHNRVIGTGDISEYTARMQRAISQRLNENPHNISGYILGEHGESQFAAWFPMFQIAEEQGQDLDGLDKEAGQGGCLVFNGEKYTGYAIATCVVKLVQTILSDAKLVCLASVYLDRYDYYVGYPAVIGKNGAEKINEIPLTPKEQSFLNDSATMIAQKTDDGYLG